jgi:putative transposase
MPQGLTRHYGQGDLHFVSFSCYHRIPFLKSPQARNAFVEILGQLRDRYEFLLLGYVVMPDHVHLLISEPKKGTPSTVVQVLKQRSSRLLRDKSQRKNGAQPMEEQSTPRQFWQTRFYDFNVWSREKEREKLDYMHANPSKNKLVGHPRDWPWSSFWYYETGERGLLRIDVRR